MKLTLPLLLLGTAILIVAACISPEAKEAHDAFVAAYTEANADGVITEAEAVNLKALFQTYVEAAGEDVGNIEWQQMGLTALGTLVFALTGVRLMPNSMILGKKAASALPGSTA